MAAASSTDDEPRSIELERAIAERPNDLSLFDVYADWLQENDNPRGELASVQLARERAAASSKSVERSLEKKEAALLEQHADLLYGKPNRKGFRLDGYCNRLDYRGGFWRALQFSGSVDFLDEVLAHPSARLLYSLAIGYIDESDSYVAAITTIAKHKLEALRVLRIGDMPEGQSALAGFGNRTCGDIEKLASACPRLDTLRLLCPNFRIAPGTTFPTLRVIDARMGIDDLSIASIAGADLPSLEELSFGFELAAEQDPFYASMLWGDAALDPVLTGEVLPALKRLRLWPMPEDELDKMVAKVQASPLGRRPGFQVEVCNDLEGDEDDDGSYTI